jgi:hypothetical protein
MSGPDAGGRSGLPSRDRTRRVPVSRRALGLVAGVVLTGLIAWLVLGGVNVWRKAAWRESPPAGPSGEPVRVRLMNAPRVDGGVADAR